MSVIERLLRRDADGAATTIGDLTIEPMRRRDLRGGVMAIEVGQLPAAMVAERVRERDRPGALGNAALSGGSAIVDGFRPTCPVVGYGGLWFAADEGHVTNVAVAPAEQRRGVATALLLGLADEAIRHGCIAWTLEVRVSSTGAQELYRRFGFAPAGVRTRYYENTEDAIVMWCNDIQGPDYARLLDSIREQVTA